MSVAFQTLNLAESVEREQVRPEEVRTPPPQGTRFPESFARAQIQGLVRQVFFSTVRPVRQIVFSAVDPETEVRSVCLRVAEALALETSSSVAVTGGYPQLLQYWEMQYGPVYEGSRRDGSRPLQRIAARVRKNLWLMPAAWRDGEPGSNASLLSYLGEIRREFEYSVVEGLPAAASSEATAMAQFADGIILVLSAQRTRRATARRIKEMLEGAQTRLLGTVLADREFPIPERIYRRL